MVITFLIIKIFKNGFHHCKKRDPCIGHSAPKPKRSISSGGGSADPRDPPLATGLGGGEGDCMHVLCTQRVRPETWLVMHCKKVMVSAWRLGLCRGSLFYTHSIFSIWLSMFTLALSPTQVVKHVSGYKNVTTFWYRWKKWMGVFGHTGSMFCTVLFTNSAQEALILIYYKTNKM